MMSRTRYLPILIVCSIMSHACRAEVVPSSCQTTDNKAYNKKKTVNAIVIKSNDIFDESAPDAFFIHRWANYLHINTRESVIRDRLSFSEQDEVSQKDLEEVQRILRAQAYIRDATVTFSPRDPDADLPDEGENILIETWDNWSLLPTFNLGRSGGESEYSIGVKEDNLLGLGIRTDFKYGSDTDRTGYKFAIEAPVNFIEHARVSADFHDNSDGQATHFSFYKPFYTLDTQDMYSTEYLDDSRTDTLKQNGMDINEFEHKLDYLNLQYGWLLNKSDEALSRLITGITLDRHQFSPSETYPDSQLPRDRDFLYPWIAYEYLQDDFEVLNNVHLINHNEDFNLGWHHYLRLGLETRDSHDNSPVGYHLDWQSSRGYRGEDELLLLTMKGTGVFATSQEDFYNLNVSAEYFYQIDPKWTAYSRVRLSTSKNNYLDQTFALGDETGIRGYQNDYQHGDNQWLFTAELRNYPNINLYQLAELGWAVFTDVGQAFGGPDGNNEVSGPIGSVGIGARVYSPKSSYGNVAHIDFSLPFTTGVEVNSWEWRIRVKNSF